MIEAVNENNIIEYEAFVQKHPYGSYLQSSVWSRQNPDWRWSALIRRNRHKRITGTCAVLIREVRFLPWQLLYICRGPVCDPDDSETLRELLEGVRRLARREGACIARLDVPFPSESFHASAGFHVLGALKYKFPKKRHYDAILGEREWIYRISGRSWLQLQSDFLPVLSQNLQIALRNGIEIRRGGKALVSAFAGIMERKALMHKQMDHLEEYYAGLVENFGQQANIYLAYRENKPIAGIFMIRHGGKYFCAAEACLSSPTLHAAELLRAAVLQSAAEAGCEICIFTDVPEFPNDPEHRDADPNWLQYSCFGGELTVYPGEADWTRNPIGAALFSLVDRITKYIERTRYFIRIR